MNIWGFLVLTSLISTIGWLANNWIRARHGYPINDDEDEAPSRKRMDAVCAENRELKGQVGRLEERLKVLERIATDPAERTAREIESLR
jgi:ubiquinone biosynthesis protein UbiJ